MSRTTQSMSSRDTTDILSSVTLLVVDDDDVIASAVSNMLRSGGATVFTSYSAAEALDCLDKNPVDAVFSDLTMEEMDGFELMESVKQRDNTLSVVIMSTHASPDTAMRARNLGASAYLRKPFKSDVCVEAAARAVNERREKIGIQSLGSNQKTMDASHEPRHESSHKPSHKTPGLEIE